MSRLDGSEGLAALGDLLEREPRLGDGVSRQDEGEDPAVLGDLLEREPRLGDGEDVDSLGDDLENANGTVVQMRPTEMLKLSSHSGDTYFLSRSL